MFTRQFNSAVASCLLVLSLNGACSNSSPGTGYANADQSKDDSVNDNTNVNANESGTTNGNTSGDGDANDNANESGEILLTEDDVASFAIVMVHPYNDFQNDRDLWEQVITDYHIDYVDRNNSFNDVYYGAPGSSSVEDFQFAAARGVASATYYSYDLIILEGEDYWSFDAMYSNFLNNWYDIDGNLITDPILQGASLTLDGDRHEHWDVGRIKMSTSNPNFLRYHKDSMDFSVELGARGFNWDFLGESQLYPDHPDLRGFDWSGWAVDAFREYLGDKYTAAELRTFGITDQTTFDVKEYRLAMGELIADSASKDPILKEFYVFNHLQHQKLMEQLVSHGRMLVEQTLSFMPIYGNTGIGGPLLDGVLWNWPAVHIAGVTDIVQLETVPVIYPLDSPGVPPDVLQPGDHELPANQQNESLYTNYKLGQAMGGHDKPVWSLYLPLSPDSSRGVNLELDLDNILRLYMAEAYHLQVIPEIDVGGWPGMDYNHGLFVRNGSTIEVVEDYLGFVDQYRDLLVNVDSAARTAVVVSMPTLLWRSHFWNDAYWAYREAIVGFARALEHMNRIYDFVILPHPEFGDESGPLLRLLRYEKIVLPLASHLTTGQRNALAEWVSGGGTLIVVGDLNANGIKDEYDNAYGDNWLTGLSASSGSGQVITVDDSEVSTFAADQEESLAAMETPFSSTEPIVQLGVAQSERRNISLNVVTKDDKTIVHLVNYNFEQDPDGHPSTADSRFNPYSSLGLSIEGSFTLAALYNADTTTVTDLSITRSESGSRSEVVIPSLQTWCFVVFE